MLKCGVVKLSLTGPRSVQGPRGVCEKFRAFSDRTLSVPHHSDRPDGDPVRTRPPGVPGRGPLVHFFRPPPRDTRLSCRSGRRSPFLFGIHLSVLPRGPGPERVPGLSFFLRPVGSPARVVPGGMGPRPGTWCRSGCVSNPVVLFLSAPLHFKTTGARSGSSPDTPVAPRS